MQMALTRVMSEIHSTRLEYLLHIGDERVELGIDLLDYRADSWRTWFWRDCRYGGEHRQDTVFRVLGAVRHWTADGPSWSGGLD